MNKTLHLIGNAHIDPVWLWPWTEGLAEVVATFRSALDRMEEFPDFTFTASSAAFYEWIERVDPAMFAEIQRRVAEGRWHITGGWWIEPDCNIPSGESFTRQGLYGQRFFRSRFGQTARTGFCPDSFGHNGMLPQILKKSGLENYVFMRPMPHEMELPGRVFWWQAPDGSQVLTCRLPIQYGTWSAELEQHLRDCAKEIRAPLDELLCFYGVGDHGGGPTVENLKSLKRHQQDATLPTLVFSSLEAFFDQVRAKNTPLPVVSDDLQHHASGCYAAQSGIKRWNRETENALLAAEKYASVAAWQTGLPYPLEFERAWKQLLFNQFHDILAGTSLESAYEEARNQLGEARAIAGRARAFATQSLAQQVNLPFEAGVQPYVVFNPNAWPVHLPVEIEPGPLDGSEVLLDAQGQAVAYQLVQAEGVATGRGCLCILADLPGLGYQTYRLVRENKIISPIAETSPKKSGEALATTLKTAGTCLENEFLRLEIDAHTGLIVSLFDLRRGIEVMGVPGGRALVMNDPSDTWSHDVKNFHQLAGEFTAQRVALVETGPVRAAVRVESTYEHSTLTLEYSLYAGYDQVVLKVAVDWHERMKLLKLSFPANLDAAGAAYEIPFGAIARPADGEEEPGQGWVDVSGKQRGGALLGGLALINDGKYSFDVQGSTLSLTVLRSPAYTHHFPYQLEAGKTYRVTDQGEQRFTLALYPHAGDWRTPSLSRLAAELNQPPSVLQTSFHAGALAQSASFVSAAPGNILVSALKQAEGADDLILRAYEAIGEKTLAVIDLAQWGRKLSMEFGPAEIKTLRIPRDPTRPVMETNLLED